MRRMLCSPSCQLTECGMGYGVGCDPIHNNTSPGNWRVTSPQSLPDVMRERETIHGILGCLPDSKTIGRAVRRGIKVVSTVNLIPHSRLPLVCQDDYDVGEMAAQEFLSSGFRHFGCILLGHFGFALARLRGFRVTLDSAGHSCQVFECKRTVNLMMTRPHPSFGRRLVSWLKSLEKPVAIFASDDQPASNLVDACSLAGLSVPDDVAVIGADNDDGFCSLAQTPLSSIEMPGTGIGYKAADLLHSLLSGKPTPKKPVLLRPLRMVVRQFSDITVTEDPILSAALRHIHAHAHEGIGTKHLMDIITGRSARTLHRRFVDLVGAMAER